jgi:hypothetical protein
MAIGGARLGNGARPVERSTVAHTFGAVDDVRRLRRHPMHTPSRLTAADGGSATATLLIRIDCMAADLWPGFFNGWRSAPRHDASNEHHSTNSAGVRLRSPLSTLPAGVVSRRFRNVHHHGL